MRVRQLRNVISAEQIELFDNGITCIYERQSDSDSNEYLSNTDRSLWDEYGDREIEKTYPTSSYNQLIELMPKEIERHNKMTVKRLREALEPYKDDMEVVAYMGSSALDRKIEKTMNVVNSSGDVVGIGLQIEN